MSDERLETIQLIRQSVKDFVESKISPHVMEWDESLRSPGVVFKEIGQRGFMGILVPEV